MWNTEQRIVLVNVVAFLPTADSLNCGLWLGMTHEVIVLAHVNCDSMRRTYVFSFRDGSDANERYKASGAQAQRETF